MDSDEEYALPAPLGHHHRQQRNNGHAPAQPARAAVRRANVNVDIDMEQDLELDLGDNALQENQIEQLMRYWMDERNAPELLHHREELVDQISKDIEDKSAAIDLLTNPEPGKPAPKVDQEQLSLVQLEIERVKYLLRAYLRIRTYKIETFSQYLLKNPVAKRKMTEIELGYAERYRALVEKCLTTSVTANLPERLGRLDEEEMIVKPDLDVAVFARALNDCPEITLPDGAPLAMRKGDTHMLRYRSIRRLLRDGLVRLV